MVLGYVVTSANEEEAHIISLAVRPEYRRLGIGTDILGSPLERLRSTRVVEVSLEVREDNQIASTFCEKLGFRQLRRIDHYCEDDSTAIVFERSLL
jgi:ribosomal-protein-alanine N-acetyltransferase